MRMRRERRTKQEKGADKNRPGGEVGGGKEKKQKALEVMEKIRKIREKRKIKKNIKEGEEKRSEDKWREDEHGHGKSRKR